MDKKSGFVFEISILGLLLLAVIIIAIFGLFSPARAQDSMAYVCRDTSVPWVRFQFRDLPTLDIHDSWAAVADGIGFGGQTWVMDALLDYPDDGSGITAGMAVLTTSMGTFELRGDADTLPCDEPTAEPTAAPVDDTCPAWAVTADGGKACLWDLPRAR